jgi:hypothetical protein
MPWSIAATTSGGRGEFSRSLPTAGLRPERAVGF